MKHVFFNSNEEKLNNVHPRALLLLITEMLKNDLGHGVVLDVDQIEIDKINTRVVIIFHAISGVLTQGLKPGVNSSKLYKFVCRHSNNFSCSSTNLYQI